MKVKFILNTGYSGGRREEVFEFEDGTCDTDIDEYLFVWVNNFITTDWCEVNDSE